MKTYTFYDEKAAYLLKTMGHTVHYQNYLAGHSQIDLVPQLDFFLSFIEVKYLSSTCTDYATR